MVNILQNSMADLPKFSSRAFLAPMAGVSDVALRMLCKDMGAGLVVTELTSIHAIIAKQRQLEIEHKKINQFIEYSERERPVAVQLFGSNLDALAKSAKIVEPFFDIIDYNMGCPAPHITQQMAGGALLQNYELTRKIFKTLVGAVKKPITLKMRAGVNDSTRFRQIAKIAEEEGIQMITLHARTVNQGYSGQSDWTLIRQLKDLVSIPVVGNGDVSSPELAKKMITETGCDYVMIGRAAMGNPFLFKQVDEFLKTGTYQNYSAKHQIAMFLKYVEYALNYNIKFQNIRQQAMRFTKGLVGSTKIRSKIMFAKTIDDLKAVMIEIP
jgi:tRNA-dihydrouridine synthase B